MEEGVHQYYQGQPVVTLGLDTYNGSPAAVEVFRSITGVTFPLLTQGGNYGQQNSGNFRKIVIDPDGIVRYVSGQYELNINTIRGHVDTWLPLDDPTFEFTMEDTLIEYDEGFATYSYHGDLTNFMDANHQLRMTLEAVNTPDPLRAYSICTYHGCYPPDSATVVVNETFQASQVDTSISIYIYNLGYNPETGFIDTSTISGSYELLFTVTNPQDESESMSYHLYLDPSDNAIEIRPVLVNSSELVSNYPNPFNPETTIQFTVVNPGAVSLSVFNMLGQRVTTLVESPFMGAGNYSVKWRAESSSGLTLPSGNYLVELINSSARDEHRVVLMR
jgi:hypothetical protein